MHLDTEDNSGEEKLQNEAYSQCEVHLQIKSAAKQGQDETSWREQAESVAKALLPDLFNALKSTLTEEKDLCNKKTLYVRLGCRGDWPNIDMPDWAAK